MKDKNEKTDPLISVIVPIYNVEKYVRKCLESLVHQTMKEIEVICIDDGSTDDSGKIADEYVSNEFPIFKVIHTENRGLSAARNRGIDEAVAEWLMFVDSDDWVESDFCRIPYEAALENNADMVIFGAYVVKREKIYTWRKFGEIPSGKIDEFTAHQIGGTVAWNKLYNKGLFSFIRYPVGRVYEEIATTHKLVHEANRIILLHERLYYQIYRNDSISHTHTESNFRDRFTSSLEKYEDLLSYGYPKELNDTFIYSAAITYITSVMPTKDTLYMRASFFVNSKHEISSSLTKKQRLVLLVWSINKKAPYLVRRKIDEIIQIAKRDI